MAQAFTSGGIPAVAIWSGSPDEERRAALSDLAQRRINIVFCVDLYNEGIDVPTLDTLLMLCHTDSATLFIQQLGRGLRLSPGKRACTVLDFVGHHRKEFRYDRRLRALLGGTRKDLATQVEAGFPFLPTGCRFELDRVAKEIVLQSIREALPSRWKEKVEALMAIGEAGQNCSLQGFLAHSGLELEDLYASGKSWSDLCCDAHRPAEPSGPHEETLRRAIGRLLHIDDMTRIEAYRGFLGSARVPDPKELTGRDKRLLRMLAASLADEVAAKGTSLREGVRLLWQHPQVLAELRELLDVLAARIEHLPIALASHADVPLNIHARYTRIEIFAAFGVGESARAPLWVTGVHWAREAEADLLAFTLDKTSGEFSERTRYRDYAIDRNLIHWQSQSVTRADSETGLRYQRHVSMGTCVMLFARNRTDERAFYFLGPATYVKHESERPMAIVWRLEHSLPADLFASFAAAVA